MRVRFAGIFRVAPGLLFVTLLAQAGSACRGRGNPAGQDRTSLPDSGPAVGRPAALLVAPAAGPAAPISARARPILVAAAGDIAGRYNRHVDSAALLLEVNRRTPLDAVLVLGDLQYPRGDLHDFLAYYHPTWGQSALRVLTRPVPGNHEYDQGRSDAQGYFNYFNGFGQLGGMAGDRDKGYYSFDLGAWHFVALNSSDGCRKVPCAVGSAMQRWLVADLAATKQRCVLAYWHHPRFQIGSHGDNRATAPLWNALVDAGAEVILAGHDHNFQQLARMDKEGRPDQRGPRSFVVGTGGAAAYPTFDEQEHTNTIETRFSRRTGFLLLSLTADAFAWRFVATNGTSDGEVLAAGQDFCR